MWSHRSLGACSGGRVSLCVVFKTFTWRQCRDNLERGSPECTQRAQILCVLKKLSVRKGAEVLSCVHPIFEGSDDNRSRNEGKRTRGSQSLWTTDSTSLPLFFANQNAQTQAPLGQPQTDYPKPIADNRSKRSQVSIFCQCVCISEPGYRSQADPITTHCLLCNSRPLFRVDLDPY